MPDERTISLLFLKQGDEEFIAAMRRMTATMESAIPITTQLTDRLAQLYEAKKISTRELLGFTSNLANVEKQLVVQERERAKVLSALERENERYNAELSKQDAMMAKVSARTAELNATALGRFTANIYGGAAGLEKFERNAYDASRQAALFSRSLATRPIATLRAFTASTEKAAIASQFLREQLAFVAASRFGTILIGFAIFGTIAKTIHEAAEATAEMDKAIHRVASAFIDAQAPQEYFDQIQRNIKIGAVETGKSFKELGDVLWELKSAGLSTAETFAFFDTNVKLSTLNAANMEKTIRLTAGLYRTFGDEIEGALTPMEKMNYIGDLLVYTLNKSADDLPGIMNAFKYVSSTADLAGVSIEEVAASIIVLNNHMIHSGIAGRSMNQALLHLARNADAVAKAFDLAIDPTKPADLESVMRQLAERTDITSQSMNELSNTMQLFGVRGGRAFATVIQNAKEWVDILDDIKSGDLTGGLDRLFEIQMDNLTDQWARFVQVVRSSLIFEDIGNILKNSLKTVNDLAEAFQRMQNASENLPSSMREAYREAEKMQTPIGGVFTSLQYASEAGPAIAGSLKDAAKWAEKWALGVNAANDSMEESASVQEAMNKYVASNLSDSEKYVLELAKGNVSLQEQLKHHEKITNELIGQLALALREGAAEEARASIVQNLATEYNTISQLQAKIAKEIEDARKEQEKARKSVEDYNEELRKSVEFQAKLGQLYLQVGEKTPAKEIAAMGAELEKAIALLRAAEPGTDAWRNAVLGTYDAYIRIANVQDVINKAVDEAISKTQQLQSIGLSYVDDLINAGSRGQASAILQQRDDELRKLMELAKTDDQRLQLLKQQEEIARKQAELSGRGQWKILDIKRQEYELGRKIQEEAMKNLTSADDEKAKLDEIVAANQKILEGLPQWETFISQASRETENLKNEMFDVREILGGINAELGTMASKISSMPSLNVGDGSGPGTFLSDAEYN